MKRVHVLIVALALVASAQGATIRTASETFVTNCVGAAVRTVEQDLTNHVDWAMHQASTNLSQAYSALEREITTAVSGATNNAARTYVKKSGDTMTSSLNFDSNGKFTTIGSEGIYAQGRAGSVSWPTRGGTFAVSLDVSDAAQAGTNYADSVAASAYVVATNTVLTHVQSNYLPLAWSGYGYLWQLDPIEDSIYYRVSREGNEIASARYGIGNLQLQGDSSAGISTTDWIGFWIGEKEISGNSTATFYGHGFIEYADGSHLYEYVFPQKNGTLAMLSDATAAASDATNYTDSVLGSISAASLGAVPTTRKVNNKALSADINLTASDVGATTVADVYRLVAGTNVVDVITNYDSAVHMPARYLQQLDTNNVWHTIWDERTRHAATLSNAVAAVASATNALAGTKADRAWSKYTSGLGYDAPEGTTWISTPTTVIAGGYEYQRTVTSSGQYWFLTSNGMTSLQQAATNAYLNIASADGTPIFRIEKTDAVLVGVNASAITMSGSTAIVSVPVVAASHPYARVCTNLTNATWYKEDENGMPAGSPASVSWSGSSGAWVATVDFGVSPQGFCYFEFLQEGTTKIVHDGVTDLSGGIIFNGTRYFPRVNGTKLEFVAEGN